MYGFALVLFELITREIPFDGLSAERVSALVAWRGRRPQLPPDIPAGVDQLIQQCWGDRPSMRLTFSGVQGQLTKLHETLNTTELAWLDSADGHPSPAPLPGEERVAPSTGADHGAASMPRLGGTDCAFLDAAPTGDRM